MSDFPRMRVIVVYFINVGEVEEVYCVSDKDEIRT